MDAKLVLLAEDGRPGEFKLKLPVIVGRSRQAGLTVLHSSVSRQHCELTEYEGQLVVNDLGSLNGTFIEETRIAEPTILPDGGLLRVGSVRFQAVYGASDLAPPSVPAPKAAGATANEELPTISNDEEASIGKPETIPLEPAAAVGDEELELMLDEDAAAPADTPLGFMPWDEPAAPPAAPIPAPPAAKKPAASTAPRRAPAPAPAPTPAPAKAAAPQKAAPQKAAPQKAASAEEQTVSFHPGEPEPPHDEALADDLDSFFKSLQQ